MAASPQPTPAPVVGLEPRPATDPAGLVARTIPLPDPPDLLAGVSESTVLWRSETAGLAGEGVALRIDLPGGLEDLDAVGRVGPLLAGIRAEDHVGLPGCGPVAMGALPFDPSAPGHLVVPRRLVGYRDGRAWMTTVEPAGAAPTGVGTGSPANTAMDARGPNGAPPSPPDQFTLTPSRPHDEWRDIVAHAVARLRRGELRKVVLARRVDVSANRPFLTGDVLSRLLALYPSCMIFHVEGFLGASPELLLERTGDRVASHPLAGTVARSGDAAVDDALVASLFASAKDRLEHQLVVDDLRDALQPWCEELEVADRPAVLGLRNVSHLATPFRGRLRTPGAPSAFELVARVHPTPAIGGSPRGPAMRYLAEVEGFDRGRYGGPVGWVDARGDGTWAVAIRSAEVAGSEARMYAGVGVVPGSDPGAELAETQLKLQALLAALVRP